MMSYRKLFSMSKVQIMTVVFYRMFHFKFSIPYFDEDICLIQDKLHLSSIIIKVVQHSPLLKFHLQLITGEVFGRSNIIVFINYCIFSKIYYRNASIDADRRRSAIFNFSI